MRDIGFMVWHFGRKKMYKIGSLMFTNRWIGANALNNSGEDIGDTIGINYFDESHEVFVLLQCTGLCLMKTGKKVFESFIIKTPNGHIGKIVFGKKKYRFGIDEIEVNGWLFERLSDGHLEVLDSSILEGELLGNIYENPELLS